YIDIVEQLSHAKFISCDEDNVQNIAKYHIRLSRKKADRIFKKKTNKLKIANGVVDGEVFEELSKDDNVDKEEVSTEVASERMCMDEEQEGPPKKVPIVREGKLRRTELPLRFCDKQKGNARTDKVKTKAAKTSVVPLRQMSKKKARKILRAQRRERRQQERMATAMEQ
uniref:Uncharacterized protein n=1 Tax=Parascaris univalens TaxID=6257 RepID=A0A915B9H5_PARUN